MKTTSISQYNTATTNQSGKVGNIRYYQRGGQTYVRTATNRTTKNSNPRSNEQMRSRLNFNSLLAVYSLVGKQLKRAFQHKDPRHSDYNAFMHANAGIGAYMTKSEYQSGMVIPMPVIMSEGSLTPVTLNYDSKANAYVSSLIVGKATDRKIDISTIAKLSKAIINNNSGFSYGDQITFIMPWQTNTQEGCEFIPIILDADNQEAIPVQLQEVDRYLTFSITYGNEMPVVIHSNAKGEMSDSVAELNDISTATLQHYTSDGQFQTARDSYGLARTPKLHDTDPGTPLRPHRHKPQDK